MKFAQLKMIVRVWLRGGLSTIISLVSLIIGLLCSIILLLFTVTEFRMADSLTTDPNVYIMEVEDAWRIGSGAYSSGVSKGRAYHIGENYPEVKSYAIISNANGKWDGDEKIGWDGPYTIGVSGDFAQMVDIPMLEGSLEDVLGSSNKIALTRSYANTLFPDTNPMGQSLYGISGEGSSINGVDQTKEYNLVVGAIIDDTEESFLNYRAIFPLVGEDYAQKGQMGTYSAIFELHPSAVMSDFVARIKADSTNLGNDVNIRFTKLSEVYFSPQEEYSIFNYRDKNVLLIGLTISLVLLVIAAFNYVNLTLARAARRLKNLAGQRIMGASKWSVRWQVVADTTLNVLVAFALAFLLLEPCLGIFNSFMGSTLKMSDFLIFENWCYLLMLLLVLIALPAINLAIKLSSGDPLTVFKNPRGGKMSAMRNLTIAQLALSIVLVAFSINVSRQMSHISSAVDGSSAILSIENSDDDNDFTGEFIDRLKRASFVTDCTVNGMRPQTSTKDKDEFRHLIHSQCDPNFFDFYGIKMLQGRTFDSLRRDGYISIVVNETYVRQKGIEGDPIGAEIVYYKDLKYRIVGVCEDFVFDNAEIEIAPVIFRMRNTDHPPYILNVKFVGSQTDRIEDINAIYREFVPDGVMPQITTLERVIQDNNSEAVRLQTIVEFFMLVSLFLTAFGLFGLSWYIVERRRKEIAVRKVYGGSVGRLIALLCSSFMVWTLVAVIVALPVGYFVSDYWLNGFVHHIDNSIWTLILTALIAALLTFVTVIFQTARVALSNPAKYIKTE